MSRSSAAFAVLLIAVTLGACDRATSPNAPATIPREPPGPLEGFHFEGDPATAAGATWTYRATANGIGYDLAGIVLKPAGSGPFPAVVVSHGSGANVNTYSHPVALAMVGWGAVVIATNYTHSGGVPIGSPGTADERGASTSNVMRGRKLLDILRTLGYVDMNRVAAHGHSAGAFVTTALVGAAPQSFRAASHTAGGIRPDNAPAIAAQLPSESQASTIRAPYQMHHGDADFVVPLLTDQFLASLLSSRRVTNELVVHPGAGHNEIAASPDVYARIRAWYTTHGMF